MIVTFLRAHRKRLLPVAVALLGVLFLARGISAYKRSLGYGMRRLPVLVAARELPDGRTLREGDLIPRDLPENFLPVGSVREGDFQTVIGRPILRPMAKGELLLWSSIDTGDGPSGPARSVARGYRAISLEVDGVTSVARAIRPRDRVDLLATLPLSAKEGSATFALLQDVAVLEVGEGAEEDGGYSVVTLMVRPGDGVRIAHAQQHAKLTLALRHPDDHTAAQLPVVRGSDLLDSASERSRVEILRGGRKDDASSLP